MMSFSHKIRGVIFDVDGVLLDSLEIWTDLGARYLISIGKVPEEGLAETLFSMSMEQGAEYLKENYDIDRSAEDIVTGLRNLLRDFYYYEVFPDIYNAAAADMHTAPEETMVFEDSLYALKTAAAAGYHTIGVADCKGEPDQDGLRETADIYISELREAVELF